MSRMRMELPLRAAAKKAALAMGLVLAIANGPNALAQQQQQQQPIGPTCSYQDEDRLLTVTNPDLVDRQLIMDLIHRYLWALDKPPTAGVGDIFLNGVTYELCSAAGEQLELKTGREQLTEYFTIRIDELGEDNSQTRHFESNTLLNAIDIDTVEGKTALLVTIQFAGIEVPVLDYTATLHTLFRRDQKVWKFSRLILVTDTPEITLRAR